MANSQSDNFKYNWMTSGDLNAFFGLMVDNISNLVILSGILMYGFGYPADFIYNKMIPGTALGVLIGDIVYTIMAMRLAARTKNNNVTAMPLGLDTPSTIGIAVAVLGPAFKATNNPELTWKIGMATLILIGIIKVIMSFFGEYVQKIVPKAGLLGSIGGIGVALLCCLPLLTLFKMPVVGLIALGVILYSLIAGLDLPFKTPGVFASVLIGAFIYHVLGYAELNHFFGNFSILGEAYKIPEFSFQFHLPIPSAGFLDGWNEAIKYLPIALPFGLLTIIGGINVTESARCAGDEYNTRDILLTEAIATLVAGLSGGVAQSTPYIGHPAYKHMGARAGYTLLTGLFIGLGGMFGYLTWMLQILPEACVAPILIFVGLEIASQSYHECPREHAPAVTFAFLPIIMNLLMIITDQICGEITRFTASLPANLNIKFAFSHGVQSTLNVIGALGHGFILTGMLWGAALSLIIDRKLTKAGHYFLLTAFMTFFGIIHSVSPNGDIYLPWNIGSPIPYQFGLSYLLLGIMMYFFAKQTKQVS